LILHQTSFYHLGLRLQDGAGNVTHLKTVFPLKIT